MRGAAETKKAACVLQVKHRLVLLGSESAVLNQKDKRAQKIHPSRCCSAGWNGGQHVDDASSFINIT